MTDHVIPKIGKGSRRCGYSTQTKWRYQYTPHLIMRFHASCVGQTRNTTRKSYDMPTASGLRTGARRHRVRHCLNFAWHGHGSTHLTPWHLLGIPWRGIGFYGTPWGVPGDRVRVRVLGLGLGLGLRFHGMPWRSVEGSVVRRGRCRGRLCRWWCHGMPRYTRYVVKKTPWCASPEKTA